MAEEGSFSATDRRLRTARSAIGEMMGNLESQLGVSRFDCGDRSPRLTTRGGLLLAYARAVVRSVDSMKARVQGISEELEAELLAVLAVVRWTTEQLSSSLGLNGLDSKDFMS